MSEQTALETERDFLLRSLDDLESERDAGNIDDETYRTLHEDYTARAAVVIRSLRDDVAPVLPAAPRTSRRAKVITVVLLVAFAGIRVPGDRLARRPRPDGARQAVRGDTGERNEQNDGDDLRTA